MRRERVVLDRTGGGAVARITMPGGALAQRDARELVDIATELREERSIRVVVIGTEAADWCTGPADDLDRLAVVPDPASAVASLRPPVVAVCRGRCASVGLEVLLATDIRVAAPDATFALDDLARGGVPCWGGSQRLARAIRPAAATAMLLLGDRLDADRARSLGLVYDIADDPVARAEEHIDRLSGLGPLALEFAKEAVHRGAELPLRDGLRLEGDLNHQLAATGDRREGLAAFGDKRPPDFAGR